MEQQPYGDLDDLIDGAIDTFESDRLNRLLKNLAVRDGPKKSR